YGRKVQVVGLTCFDRFGNNLDAVRKLVAQKSDRIGYSIAWDQQVSSKYMGIFQGRSVQDLMGRSALQALPSCIAVDSNGRVAAIGLPSSIDEDLEKIVRGSWNLQEARSRYEGLQAAEIKLKPLPDLLAKGKNSEALALAQPIA